MAGQPFADLGPEEQHLRGQWIGEWSSAAGDAVEQRIRWLVANRLVARGRSVDGWDWLFQDPGDGRLWELTFPLGTVHGSGPRELRVMAAELATAKYGQQQA